MDRLTLVTDAMAAAGLGPGAYRLGGRRVFVDATSVRLENGVLAGSILTMDQAVRNVYKRSQFENVWLRTERPLPGGGTGSGSGGVVYIITPHGMPLP